MSPQRQSGGRAPRTSAARALAAPLLALAALTLAGFWPVRSNGFVTLDDGEYITGNAVVAQGITRGGVALAFTKSYAANWHPLTWLSHMLDVELFGLNPGAHHLVGLAIHLATALLLFGTLRAMTGRAGPAFGVAALFAVHPLHVESVAWASERKDVLSGLLWVLAMAAHLRYARRPRPGPWLAVLLLFALGLMAKPMVVTLPLALLLLDFWPLGRWGVPGVGSRPAPGVATSRVLLEKVPLLALSALSALITVRAQATGGAVLPLADLTLAARAENAVVSYVRYLGKTLWPSALASYYPLTAIAPGALAGAALLLAAVSAAVFALRASQPWLVTGWVWYLVTLLPVIGLVQVGEQAMADRYTYLPLIGVFLAAVWGLAHAARGRPAARASLAVAAAAVLLALAALANRQAAVWHDSESLYRHALRVTEGNWRAAYNLGLVREAAGDREEAKRLYREAMRMNPGFSKARYAYARELDAKGRTAEALQELRGAVEAQPDDPVVRMALALMLERQGLDEEAILNLREFVRRRPNVAEGYNNLGVLLARRGDLEEAGALLRRALELDPGYADARRNLAALSGTSQSAGAAAPGAPASGPPEERQRGAVR